MAVNVIALVSFIILVIGKDLPARYKSLNVGPKRLYVCHYNYVVL